MSKNCALYLLLSILICACEKDSDKSAEALQLTEIREEYSAGDNTTFDFSENAFGEASPNLSVALQDTFVIGNSFFRSNWVMAGASAQARDGLGPVMNAVSCGACHFKDGRGSPPNSNTDELNALLFRLSINGEDEHGRPNPDPNYGGQLNNKAIMGVEAEGTVKVSYEEIKGNFADGSVYTLRKPLYEFSNLKYGALAADIHFSPRIAQQIPGLGSLESIEETTILMNADENDANGDGISGKPNYVWDVKNQKKSLGRFGWKANQPSIFQQTAAAFNGDIGITTSLFPNQNLTDYQYALYGNLMNGGSPELPDEKLNAVVTYIQTLAVPARRDFRNGDVLRGKQLFTQLKCNSCHIPKMKTGMNAVSDLANQEIRPYTDLLLHDMGTELADNRADFLATGSEWRTAPLWGIGMVQIVNKHTFLLHDGRARTIEEAILWHDGEAKLSKEGYTSLSKTDRNMLLRFLNSL
ncbi:MAG: di-heme oxidoredictase family protein [Cytophagales bacterium]